MKSDRLRALVPGSAPASGLRLVACASESAPPRALAGRLEKIRPWAARTSRCRARGAPDGTRDGRVPRDRALPRHLPKVQTQADFGITHLFFSLDRMRRRAGLIVRTGMARANTPRRRGAGCLGRRGGLPSCGFVEGRCRAVVEQIANRCPQSGVFGRMVRWAFVERVFRALAGGGRG